MSQSKNKVADVTFADGQPTTLTFRDLYTWTIWQFPRKVNGGLCGAVRPPIAEHEWYPAVVQFKEEKVQVYAHLNQTFPTPENAAEQLEKGNASANPGR